MANMRNGQQNPYHTSILFCQFLLESNIVKFDSLFTFADVMNSILISIFRANSASILGYLIAGRIWDLIEPLTNPFS